MTHRDDDEALRQRIRAQGRNDVERADLHPPDEAPPNNVIHGSVRYVRSQRHLNGLDRVGARGGRDVVTFEQETWRGRDEVMRRMHGTSSGSGAARSSGGVEAGGEQRPAAHEGAPAGARGPRRSARDLQLRDDVHEALTVHDVVDATDIEVDVKDGVVTLSGTVPTREERRSAEEAAYTRGIVDVVNALRVQPREPIGARSSPFARARVEP